MTIKEALRKTTHSAEKNNVTLASKKTEDILSFVLNKPKEYLYTYPEQKLKKIQEFKFRKLSKHLCNHEPLAYILGYAYFHNLKFKVDKNVLIPRPETEELIEYAKEFIDKQKSTKLNIIDVGTGSGNIIITLASQINSKNKSFFAVDINDKILKIANFNAQENNVSNKITFLKGNLLEPLKSKKIDLIIANLPYLSKKEYTKSPHLPELSFEPTHALTDNKDGLSLIYELIQQSPKYLKPKGQILLEIGFDQGNEIKNFTKKIYPKSKITIIKDFCGFDRFVKVQL